MSLANKISGLLLAALIAMPQILASQQLPTVLGPDGTPEEAVGVVILDGDGGFAPSASASEPIELTKTRQGVLYAVSTPLASVSTGNSLYLTLTNSAGSGKNLVLYNRLFTNDRGPTDVPVNYRAFLNPSVELNQPLNLVNTNIGTPTDPGISAAYQIGDLALGAVEATGELLPTGTPYNRPLYAIVPPGTTIGFAIFGQGNNLTNAAVLTITLEFWLEDI